LFQIVVGFYRQAQHDRDDAEAGKHGENEIIGQADGTHHADASIAETACGTPAEKS